jgi:hypothetical protein
MNLGHDVIAHYQFVALTLFFDFGREKGQSVFLKRRDELSVWPRIPSEVVWVDDRTLPVTFHYSPLSNFYKGDELVMGFEESLDQARRVGTEGYSSVLVCCDFWVGPRLITVFACASFGSTDRGV